MTSQGVRERVLSIAALPARQVPTSRKVQVRRNRHHQLKKPITSPQIQKNSKF